MKLKTTDCLYAIGCLLFNAYPIIYLLLGSSDSSLMIRYETIKVQIAIRGIFNCIGLIIESNKE